MRIFNSDILVLLGTSFFLEEKPEVQPVDLGALYEPEAIPFSFNSPGWYILATLIVFLTLLAFIKWAKHHKKNKYRRLAMHNIEMIEKQFIKNPATPVVNEIMVVIKTTAITAFGREEVANLHGKQWLSYLSTKAKNTNFTEYFNFISDAVYKGTNNDKKSTEAVIELTKKWIKTHA